MRNCANYGSITYSGTVSSVLTLEELLEVLQEVHQSTSRTVSTTAQSHTMEQQQQAVCTLEGVLGYTASGTNNIENCVSGGKITSKGSGYIGSVVGKIDSEATTRITHCYWSSDVGCGKACELEVQQLALQQSKLSSMKQ